MAFSKFVQAKKTGGTPPAPGKAPPFPPKKAPPPAAPAGAKAAPPAADPKKKADGDDPTKCPDCGKTIPPGEDECPNCADGDETDTTKAPNPLMMWAVKNSTKAKAPGTPAAGKPPTG